jgi:hypothetical protein
MPSGLWIGDAYAHGPGECEPEYAGLWEGLVGCWVPQMGPTGNRLLDLSGYGNHGTLTNMDPATDWVTGQGGWALDLDATNDYVSCGLAFGSRTELTVAAQVRFNAVGADCAIGSQFTTGQAGEWILQMDALGASGSSNVISFVIRASSASAPHWPWCETATNSVTANTWYSILATWKSGVGMGLYVNGVDAKAWEQSTTNKATIASEKDYRIGRTAVNAKPFNGQIVYQMTWNRYFSAAEATLQMADPLGLLRPRRRWWAVPAAAAGVYRVRRYHDRLYAPGLNPGVM